MAAKKKSVNLGREGTPSHFVRQQYLAGKQTADVVKALKKRYQKSGLNKNPAYVSWYASKMRKDGVLRARA
jgi:hypothetical protein